MPAVFPSWWRGVVASVVRRMNEVPYGGPG